MKKTKKIFSVILALIMIISIIPTSVIPASATETSGKCGDNLTWDFNEEVGALVINGIGPMYDYEYSEIPWKDYAYSTYSIYIGDDVSTICDFAFLGFEQTGSIEIGKNVAKIGESAFGYAGCNVYSGYIIIDIPVSVTEIGSYAFSGCPYMEVNYDGTEEQWNVITIGNGNEPLFDGFINFKGITQKPSGKSGEKTRWEFDQSTGTLTIAGTGEMMDFSSEFFPWIRFKRDIKKVDIKDGVTSVGDYAFNECFFVESVTISDSVTSIGKYAFAYCGSLENLTIPNSVTIIDSSAFYDSGLTNITIPLSVTTIGRYAFYGCASLKDVCYIGTEEQWDSIAIGLDNDRLLNAAINFNPSGTCGENLTWKFEPSTGTLTISGSGPMTKYSSNTIGLIPPWDSYKHNIISLVIEEGVTSIGGDAFRFYTNLKDVTIPDSVTSIGYCSFYGCTSITDVYYTGTEEQWNKISIANYNDSLLNATIHYNYIDMDSFTGILDGYFYKDGVKQKAYQLVEFEGDYYFINDGHKLAKNKRIYLSQRFVEGTDLKVGYYNFDENGKLVNLNGPVDDYFYKDGIQLKAYQLVEFEGDYYFINNSNKLAKNTRIYLSARFVEGTDLKVGYYEFDADGKLVLLNGPVGDYFYKDNVRLNAYQLVEFEGDYYFINDSHKLAKNKRIYLSERFVEGTDLKVGYYEFDADGKIVLLNGPVGDYFYKDNVRLNAYQLVEFEGDYYFINNSNKLAKNTRIYLSQRFVEGTSLEVGYYNFDADGKLVIE